VLKTVLLFPEHNDFWSYCLVAYNGSIVVRYLPIKKLNFMHLQKFECNKFGVQVKHNCTLKNV